MWTHTQALLPILRLRDTGHNLKYEINCSKHYIKQGTSKLESKVESKMKYVNKNIFIQVYEVKQTKADWKQFANQIFLKIRAEQ